MQVLRKTHLKDDNRSSSFSKSYRITCQKLQSKVNNNDFMLHILQLRTFNMLEAKSAIKIKNIDFCHPVIFLNLYLQSVICNFVFSQALTHILI